MSNDITGLATEQALNQAELESALLELKRISEQPSVSTHYARVLRQHIANMGRRIAELDQRLIEYAGIATREARRVAELEARAVYPAILDVMGERQRQQSVEGWTPEHDDEHCNGELAMAAGCYINDTGAVNRNGGKPWGWPWDASWWKPDTRRRNLVKAGALILAEIERIDRAAGIKVKES